MGVGKTPCTLKEEPKYNSHLYIQEDNIFVCKYTPPKLNHITSLFISTYGKCNMARDGLSNALNYTVLMEIAKLNGIENELLNDFIDFVNVVESEMAIKRSEKK